MSSPSVKGAEQGLIVECVAVVVGEVEHAAMVEDSGDVSDVRALVPDFSWNKGEDIVEGVSNAEASVAGENEESAESENFEISCFFLLSIFISHKI